MASSELAIDLLKQSKSLSQTRFAERTSSSEYRYTPYTNPLHNFTYYPLKPTTTFTFPSVSIQMQLLHLSSVITTNPIRSPSITINPKPPHSPSSSPPKSSSLSSSPSSFPLPYNTHPYSNPPPDPPPYSPLLTFPLSHHCHTLTLSHSHHPTIPPSPPSSSQSSSPYHHSYHPTTLTIPIPTPLPLPLNPTTHISQPPYNPIDHRILITTSSSSRNISKIRLWMNGCWKISLVL